MFTGIVEATADVLKNEDGKLVLRRPAPFHDLTPGSSVCVAGACLTVTALAVAEMAFDVVPETLRKTTLGALKAGDRVNLERAMRADGRFEGHIVQGHVEGVGKVKAISGQLSADSDVQLAIELPTVFVPFILPKGSVTIDGVSLTVADVSEESFSGALVPTTLRVTTLGALRAGDRVNIETDLLGRYVRRFLPHP
ncbi:MAG: riboflavin synthase [Candidatus Peribacteraceae bacterium]|jgi:riboflavin synthase